MEKISYTRFETPWGWCLAACSIQGVVQLTLPGKKMDNAILELKQWPNVTVFEQETFLLKKVKDQLLKYLAGKKKTFDLPLDFRGTPFQKKVWGALSRIPYAQTRSYQDIAEAIGNPKATRAVGMANNRNPLPILVPCHRVIGKDGSMVGYGGGLSLKKKLLSLEFGTLF